MTLSKIIEQLKTADQNKTGMFELGEDVMCALVELLEHRELAGQEITGWRALQNDNRDLREPLYLDGFNDPVGWNSDYAPVYAAPAEPVAQPVQMPTVAKLKEIYSLFCTPTTGSDNAMTAIHKSCRAAMYGTTISNSADFAIDEVIQHDAALNQTHVKQPASNGVQSFGNSEQLNSPAAPDCSTACPCCGRKPLKNRTCSVVGCDEKHLARGLCKNHYYIERRKDPERKEIIRAADARYRARRAAAPKQESE